MMHRRTILQSAALLALGYPVARIGAFTAAPQFSSNPFSAGVASGDPTADSIILWTRLIPDAGRERDWQRQAVDVQWEIASDEGMQHVVRRGREIATPEYGHSIHAEVRGLEPSRWYWYRFTSGSAASETGRTKTAPGGAAERIRFAFASCQNFQQGYYTAYQNMVNEDLDLVVFLGDYIYETGGNIIRNVPVVDCKTLDQYRDRYALYKSDRNLREAHRLFPWISTWDDHEVQDNYAGEYPKDTQSREEFLMRRAAAYQAYYEWMPLPKSCRPAGANARVYRRLSYGQLLNFLVLDGRQYRSDQACGDGLKPRCEESLDGARAFLGAEQEKWLEGEMRRSRSRWNVFANDVRMTLVDQRPGPDEAYAMDQWSGYDPARRRLVSKVAESRISNPVVITGDIHSNWIGDIKMDYRDPKAPVVATEIIGTSISSGGDGSDTLPNIEATLPENPQIKFYNNRRGYVRCEVTARSIVADFRVVEKVSTPEAPVSTRASFVVEAGKPGAVRL